MYSPSGVYCVPSPDVLPGREDRVGRRLNAACRKVFTTEEAATICRLPHLVILRCLANGKFRVSSLPAPGHRDIRRRELARFIKLCGFA